MQTQLDFSPRVGLALRDYQRRAVTASQQLYNTGARSVCLVMPTGSGKTITGRALIAGRRCLWIVHRIELAEQAPEGVNACTVQQLLASGERPECDVMVWDECHHVAADEWRSVAEHYRHVPMLGLTATPERSDGRPLGDIFEHLVAGATYSELLAANHLVPCRVFRPDKELGSNLAMQPLAAWQRYVVDGAQGFVYCRSIRLAEQAALHFSEAQVLAACVSADSKPADRRESLASFRDGRLQALTNVYALTEGVDVPAASVCVLARGCGHAGAYLQMVGRVLRPAPGKQQALLLDLSGSTYQHGLPTIDREYSLSGRAIRAAQPSLRTCPECGAVFEPEPTCPECGYAFPVAEQAKPRIYNMALREVYAGDETKASHRTAEWERLVAVCMRNGWSLRWAATKWRELFPESTLPASHDQKAGEWKQLERIRLAKNYKMGWSAWRYRAIFGVWPRGMR
jgi:superfamily II DNA or RNA helicase